MGNVFDRVISNRKNNDSSNFSSKSGSIFDRVLQKKENKLSSPESEDLEAKALIEKERSREPNPQRAGIRSALVSGLGTYGDIASFLPGKLEGASPGEKAKFSAEEQALEQRKRGEISERELVSRLSDLDSDILPPQSGLPTSENVHDLLNRFGFEKKEQSVGEKHAGRMGRLFAGAAVIPGVGIPLAGSTALTGSTAGQIAEEMGFGPTGQSIAEIAASLRFPSKSAQSPISSIRQPRIITKGTLPEHAGNVSYRRVGEQLTRVNQEANALAQNIGKNNRPFQNISLAIDEGVPIQQNFNKVFTNLENITHRFNAPLQDMKPLNDFIASEMRLYQGTGAPTFMGNLITKELGAWQQTGQNGLYNVFRRYRLNNERIREIISDPNFPPAFRNQAVGFFTRMNQAISESISASLPKNSRWLQAFEQSNNAYSNYMNTLQVRRVTQPLMQGSLSDAKLTKILSDGRFWENVERFLGQEESQNLKSVLTDLKTARNGLQSMKKSPPFWRGVLRHLGVRSLAGKLVASLFNIPSSWRWIKGMYYSSPEFSRSFGELSSAITERNVPAMVTAAKKVAEEKEKSKKNQ